VKRQIKALLSAVADTAPAAAESAALSD